MNGADVHVWAVELEGRADSTTALRLLLGRHLREEPAALRLVRRPGGKPALDHPWSWLGFNVAHSAGLALVALGPGREIGVDVERLDPKRASGPIADSVFSPREAAVLRSLREPARTHAFFSCWTRKEAFVKATGEGIAGIERLDVLGRRRVEGLWLFDLAVGEGHAGALAVAGGRPRVRLFRLGSGAPAGAGDRPPRGEGKATRRGAEERVEDAARLEREGDAAVPRGDARPA